MTTMLHTRTHTLRQMAPVLADARELACKVRVRTKTGGTAKGWVMSFGDTLTVGDYLHKSVAIRADNIRWIEIRGYVNERVYSDDGEPFHNGSRWQFSGDLTYQDGRCGECGKEWGASTKRIRCTCGATIYLT